MPETPNPSPPTTRGGWPWEKRAREERPEPDSEALHTPPAASLQGRIVGVMIAIVVLVAVAWIVLELLSLAFGADTAADQIVIGTALIAGGVWAHVVLSVWRDR